MMDIITRNPSSDGVFVSPQGPKHYCVFHPLFESSRMIEEELDGEEEEEEDEQEEEKVSTELTLAPASSTCQYPQYDHKVSTTLTLGFPSSTSFTNKREAVYIHNPSPFHYPKRRQLLPPDVNMSIKQEAEQEEAEEERQLPIDVNNIQHQDDEEYAEEEEEEEEERWKIRKTLTTGDLGSTCRFVETKSLAQKHLLLYWNAEFVERVLGSKGAGVIVRDCDTNSNHKLSLRYWKSSHSYLLNKRWGKFVRRRVLKEGDEIGLYWDTPTSRFMFSVLRRADQLTSSSSSTV